MHISSKNFFGCKTYEHLDTRYKRDLFVTTFIVTVCHQTEDVISCNMHCHFRDVKIRRKRSGILEIMK